MQIAENRLINIIKNRCKICKKKFIIVSMFVHWNLEVNVQNTITEI